MSSIQGIKSVDFRITATGEGVVNHNGPARVYNPNAGQTVNNHMMPKLRGVDTMRLTDAPDNTGIKSLRPLSLGSPELANAALVVSDGAGGLGHVDHGVSYRVLVNPQGPGSPRAPAALVDWC